MSEVSEPVKEIDPTHREILWRQYNLHTDLYKYYLDIVLKVNAFFYIITGGIITYFLANIKETYIKFSLILPIILSIGLGIIFIYGSRLLEVTREDVFKIRDELALETAPELKVLGFSLQIFAVIFFAVGIALIVLVAVK